MILILNHLYLGDLIFILKSSTNDDFAHLCVLYTIRFRDGDIKIIFWFVFKLKISSLLYTQTCF